MIGFNAFDIAVHLDEVGSKGTSKETIFDSLKAGAPVLERLVSHCIGY